jgi:hypothetical protein
VQSLRLCRPLKEVVQLKMFLKCNIIGKVLIHDTIFVCVTGEKFFLSSNSVRSVVLFCGNNFFLWSSYLHLLAH